MKYVKIGGIANTQGLKGTLKVKSFTDFVSERYQVGNQLYILYKNEYVPVKVQKCETRKGLEFIDFYEFDDINQVEKYKGCELYISDEYIHELDEDEYYVKELIGLQVFGDGLIGECVDVLDYPRNEILVVRREGIKDVMIPFIKEFVTKVDIKNKIIQIQNWEGLQ